MKPRLPANVTSYVDRHGKERFRYRKAGRPTRSLKGHPGTEKHPSAEYLAIAANKAPAAPRAAPGTIDDLVARFYRSAAWEGAGDESKRVRRGIIERFRAKHGSKRVAAVTFEHIEAILVATSKKRREGKRIVGGKEAARSLRKQLVRLFALAVRLKMIRANPAAEADPVKVPKTGGHHTWDEAEIAAYQKRHPLGTKPRLALEIILWTGQRRGDARLFGRKHLKGGRVNYTQGKTGTDLWLPAAPDLMEAIKAMAVVGAETFLVTDYGKPFSAAGFGNKMREWCDEAGLPQCSAHGLRKAIARRLAEMTGAGNPGLKSVGGWKNDSEVSTYTEGVDQRKMADATLGALIQFLSHPADPSDPDLANQQ